MKISKNNWLAQAYRFNFWLTQDDLPRHTNLCHFMRVILIWLPLKILIGAGGAAWILFLVFVTFFIAIPGIGMWLHWLVWGLITAGFVFWYVYENHGTAIDDGLDAIRESGAVETAQILSTWVAAKKQKICPLVEIVEDR